MVMAQIIGFSLSVGFDFPSESGDRNSRPMQRRVKKFHPGMELLLADLQTANTYTGSVLRAGTYFRC